MNFVLNEENLRIISKAIEPHKEVKQTIIFGSRAMGNFKPTSDIDLVLKGDISSVTVNRIWGFLNDEAPRFPYKVDVLNYDTIVNPELKKHIDTYGKNNL